MKIISAILLATLTAGAQTAKVIQLTPEDAAQAKQLHEAVLAAQQKEDVFRNHITVKYLAVSEEKGKSTYSFGVPLMLKNGKTYIIKQGWSDFFQYSEDFKFIVPATFEKIPPDQPQFHVMPNGDYGWSSPSPAYGSMQ